MNRENSFIGSVTLVGAGPGDPDLLTMKAIKSMERADVIVYDNLVSDAIRELFPLRCKLVYVGKAKGCHSYKQDEINQLIANYALNGMNVCRVKGGDSFVFGRGGEEMLFLAKQGVKVDVVPGITAASGCSTYSNIPLTHRGLAQGCTFITAHADKKLGINWQALAQLDQTLVIYMGLTKSEEIQTQLINAGMTADKPVAIIENGCTPQQRTVIGKLCELSDLAQSNAIKSPALIIIGDVVTVSSQMDWLQQLNNKNVDSFSAETLRISA
ncbi:uroporphyrinogen-III C-methyltransferase [Vibrio viridaestus]|uniref:uroporphyrinogen-III C-methyltransferase n=1 Tax=Vibrio viridaestus TaxID=2487322 RepID=A0A3N9TCB4_9VIBR|nr:uroporphyrinogen-III C-methyltransferase [Vibrio viridaestus]RQW61848.1 uroporphyrinogen-III C-methyltransferase [Vibrio viridaestus]